MAEQAAGCDFAILGAGALGSIVGAHLARAGYRVTMLARGDRAAHVRSHGLRICGLAEFQQPVNVVSEPAELSAARVLIVATKTPGTAQALAGLRHLQPQIAFSLQNGVIKDELLARVCDALKVDMTNAGAVVLGRSVVAAHLTELLEKDQVHLHVEGNRMLFALAGA